MKQEMININANLLAEPTFSIFENQAEKVEVANFTHVKKYRKLVIYPIFFSPNIFC